MATITADWTEDVAVTMSDISPADTVTSTGDIDLDAGGYDRVLVQITLDWHATAGDYADVNIYSSADSGITIDNVVLYNRRVDAVAGGITRISQVIDGVPWVRVSVENQSNQEIESLVVEYAGRKWVSA